MLFVNNVRIFLIRYLSNSKTVVRIDFADSRALFKAVLRPMGSSTSKIPDAELAYLLIHTRFTKKELKAGV